MRFDETMVRLFILVANAMSDQEAVGRISAGRALRSMHKSTIPRVIRHPGPGRGGFRAEQHACSSLRLYGHANPPYEARRPRERFKLARISNSAAFGMFSLSSRVPFA